MIKYIIRNKIIIFLTLFCGCTPTINDNQLKIVQCSERSLVAQSAPQYSYLVKQGDGTTFYIVTNNKFQVGDFIHISVKE